MLILKLSCIFSCATNEASNTPNVQVLQPFPSKIKDLMELIKTLQIPANPVFLADQSEGINEQFFASLMDVLKKENFSEFISFIERYHSTPGHIIKPNNILACLEKLYQLLVKIFNETPCYKDILFEMIFTFFKAKGEFKKSLSNALGAFLNYDEMCNILYNLIARPNEKDFNTYSGVLFLCLSRIKEAFTKINVDIQPIIYRYTTFYAISWESKSPSLKGFIDINPTRTPPYISSPIGISYSNYILEYFYEKLCLENNTNYETYSLVWLKNFGKFVISYISIAKEPYQSLYPQINVNSMIDNCNVILSAIENNLRNSYSLRIQPNDINQDDVIKRLLRCPEDFNRSFNDFKLKLQELIYISENKLITICDSNKKTISSYLYKINEFKTQIKNENMLNTLKLAILENVKHDLNRLDEDDKIFCANRQIILFCLFVQKEFCSKVISIIEFLITNNTTMPEALKKKYMSLHNLVSEEKKILESKLDAYSSKPETFIYFSIFHDPIAEYRAELLKIILFDLSIKL